MNPPVWIHRQTVISLHERLISEFGGLGGVRDERLLDSALARPLNLLAYGSPDIFALAASYAFGLAKNHAFHDGNKRVAFTCAVLFIELNGMRFIADQSDASARTIELAAGVIDEPAYARWLQANAVPAPPDGA